MKMNKEEKLEPSANLPDGLLYQKPSQNQKNRAMMANSAIRIPIMRCARNMGMLPRESVWHAKAEDSQATRPQGKRIHMPESCPCP
jgi:hypothetical protein